MTETNVPKRSPLAMAILAFLTESPMHPYGMQRLIKERGKDQVLNIRQRASIYQTINRLERSGLIKVQETQVQEKQPDRTIYELTDDGHEFAKLWFREAISIPLQEFPEFPAALSFVTILSQEDVLQQLKIREKKLNSEIERINSGLKQHSASIPRIFLIEDEYIVAMLKAEENWIQSVIKDLQKGKLSWNFKQLMKLAEKNRSEIGMDKMKKRRSKNERGNKL